MRSPRIGKGAGYLIYILKDGETEMIKPPFVIEGPLDWTG